MNVTKLLVYHDDGHPEMFDEEAVRAFAAVGLVEWDGTHWRVHGQLHMEDFPELAVCDFCNAKPTTWYVECAPFHVTDAGEPLPMHSDEDWLACEPCGTLIAGGHRAGLIARSIAHVRTRVPAGYPPGMFVTAQAKMLVKFWRHYRGIRRMATPYREAPHE